MNTTNDAERIKNSIREQITEIQPEMLNYAMFNLKVRLVIIQQQNGRHIEHYSISL